LEQKSHVGFVLKGEFEIDCNGEAIQLAQGDALVIPEGEENRHKISVHTEVVELIFFEQIGFESAVGKNNE
jgi:quercetin dioxygenase-like cupin family protein